jgi:transposase InsO family protein
VDHHTRYTWARPIATKSEVSHHIIGWANQVRNLKETPIQTLRTDNGGEFINSTIQSWTHKEGILHHTTIPYTPQQNGVAESHNRLLLNIARTAILWSGAPKHWWGEAVVSAAHTLNHWPNIVLKGTAPLGAWSGAKPDIMHLHPWGCTSYTRIDP